MYIYVTAIAEIIKLASTIKLLRSYTANTYLKIKCESCQQQKSSSDMSPWIREIAI